MTSLAFVLGVVPLAVARGAGAAARQSMGTGVFGGMLAATFIATLFVPLFFVLVSRRRAKRSADAAARRRSTRRHERRGRLAIVGARALPRSCCRLHGRAELRAARRRAAAAISRRTSRAPRRAATPRGARLVDAVSTIRCSTTSSRRRSATTRASAQAVARVEEAEATLRAANASLLPELDLGAQAGPAGRHERLADAARVQRHGFHAVDRRTSSISGAGCGGASSRRSRTCSPRDTGATWSTGRSSPAPRRRISRCARSMR